MSGLFTAAILSSSEKVVLAAAEEEEEEDVPVDFLLSTSAWTMDWMVAIRGVRSSPQGTLDSSNCAAETDEICFYDGFFFFIFRKFFLRPL